MTLVKGKWYQIKEHPDWYFKFEVIETGVVKSSEYIHGKLYPDGRFGNVDTYTFEELEDLSVIQKYLPEEHEDKFLEKTLRELLNDYEIN